MSSSTVQFASSILGFPRMGSTRQLKFALESHWSGQSPLSTLLNTATNLRKEHWLLQQKAGLTVIPSNDFSFYDQTLDHSLLFSAIPSRYSSLLPANSNTEPGEAGQLYSHLFTYFAMARGFQGDQAGVKVDVPAIEMKKWLDTNYHYIVPDLDHQQQFKLNQYVKPLMEYREAKRLGVETRPVLLSPVSFILLANINGKSALHLSEDEVKPLLLSLLPVYVELLQTLSADGVEWVQLDDPVLVLDLPTFAPALYQHAYQYLTTHAPNIKLQLTTYFESANLSLALSLPIHGIHVDLVRAPQQLDELISLVPSSSVEQVSLGVVDGRNIWKSDLTKIVQSLKGKVGGFGEKVKRVLISSSCSLLHSPHSLAAETKMKAEFKPWLAFACEKIDELVILTRIFSGHDDSSLLQSNANDIASRSSSTLIHNPAVKDRVASVTPESLKRQSPYSVRSAAQQKKLNLPLFPTTTIGSFPQTAEVRSWRAKSKAGKMTPDEYEEKVKAETLACLRRQEEWGIDVLVDGEFDRNDMVEFFGTQLAGYLFTQNGWVQSYGSRCVKPPIIFGDVHRPNPMTLHYTSFAAQSTAKPVKGMLTGPMTCLQWSFVRDDQPRSTTAHQLALAIRDEVLDLEKAGIAIIQIDEPAIREGLPLHKSDWSHYLQWSVDAFLIASTGVRDDTQIHTHFCYSHFEDILPSICRMDADVMTIENARSDLTLLQAFADVHYPNSIGPGLYDIHSPRVPSVEEMKSRVAVLRRFVGDAQLWVNPDCGLKTRGWKEVEAALRAMVEVAKRAREEVKA